MPASPNYNDLEVLIARLDPTSLRCREQISDARHLMDIACDAGTINIRQWRVLLENISLVQSRCVTADPGDVWKRLHP